MVNPWIRYRLPDSTQIIDGVAINLKALLRMLDEHKISHSSENSSKTSLYVLYINLQWLYFTLLDPTLLFHGYTLLYSTLLNLPSLNFTPLESTAFYHSSTSMYFTLHYSNIALLHSTSLYITLSSLYFTLLHSTSLYTTLP